MEHKELTKLIEKYERMFHYAVRKSGIYGTNNAYEDYVQEARIKLVEWAEAFDTVLAFEQAYPPGYLARKLIWSLQDAQRKEQKQQQAMERWLADYDESMADNQEGLREWWLDLSREWDRLTRQEQKYVCYQLLLQTQQQDKTVSRQTVSNWRKKFLSYCRKNQLNPFDN